MAWTSGFFNSVNGDRLYNADQMSKIFEGLITDGVYEAVGDKLAVQPNSNMTIQIATGRGWFNKRWVNNDSEYLLTLADSDVLLNRYVAVCIRVDTSTDVRSAVPFLKYSEFATNPTKPNMVRSEAINEYCLAYILIKAGVTEITADVIEDTRADESVCGWVTGLITQLSTATLFDQYRAIFEGFMAQETNNFNDWFNNLQVTLDSATATRLTNALPVSVTITLNRNNWVQSGLLWTQDVTVTNMNSTKTVLIQANDSSVNQYVGVGIKCVAQSTNTLTFTAELQPDVDINVDVIHMGV